MNLEVLVSVGVPALAAVVGLGFRPRAGDANAWDVLHELARGRVRTGLERERRATLLVMLDRLPDNGVQVEDTAQGRRTIISGRVESRAKS
ncbi:hypothetical protein ACIRU3_44990 [Streptomyces sp. NPDC101151]|uniref:hypothetical protein n=1 Tax=Streptomyces sp. NPDC101151 TaxID=3366115 RepID=UPI0038232E9B